MISSATEKGLKIIEVPISAIYTEGGSTLNPVNHGFGVLARIFVMISDRRPLLFFGIPGVIMTIAGILAGIKVTNTYFSGLGFEPGTAIVSTLLVLAGIFSTFTGIVLNAISRLKD